MYGSVMVELKKKYSIYTVIMSKYDVILFGSCPKDRLQRGSVRFG